jgi:NAD(P)H-flavin reductase
MPADAAAIVLADLEHPRWDDVAERCLACGNCTAVCPTCFCTDMDDRIELDGHTARRDRVWDTCFSLEYSHLGPGPARSSPRSRYRQWLTHKLGTWHDQFGESGCVGCGRCITWCPVGIDLTAEVDALATAGSAVTSPTTTAVDVVNPLRPPGSREPTTPMAEPRVHVVRSIIPEIRDVITLDVVPVDGPPTPFLPAQVSMLGAFGIGEAAISISSSAAVQDHHEYTIRRAGAITTALCAMEPGDQFTVRGPFGQPWNLDAMRGDVVIAAGGIGLAPLRSAVYALLDTAAQRPDRRVVLVVGARQRRDLLYAGHYDDWQARGLEIVPPSTPSNPVGRGGWASCPTSSPTSTSTGRTPQHCCADPTS